MREFHPLELPKFNRALFRFYSEFCTQEALKLDGDSVDYYYTLSIVEWVCGNYAKVIDYGEKAYAMDSTMFQALGMIGYGYSIFGQHEK